MTTMNVKVIKLDNGDDIVCAFPEKQLDEKTGLIRLVKPLLIKYVPQLTPCLLYTSPSPRDS